MSQNDKYVQSIMIKSIVLIIIESILLYIFFNKDFAPLFFGLLLGGFMNLLFFQIIYSNILVAIDKSEEKAKRFMTINYMVRYIISGLVLFVAAKSSYLNIFTCLLGFLTIKIVFYINNMIDLFKGKKKENFSLRKEGKDGH